MDDIDELLAGHPPEVKKALRAALQVIEDDPRDPQIDYRAIKALGHRLQGGAPMTGLLLIDGIVAAVSLLRWGVHKHKKAKARRQRRSRRRGTAAGLAAYQASRMAGRATKR